MNTVTSDAATPTTAQSVAATAAGQGNLLVSQREVPWMKLGRLVDEPMTAAEAADAGGLNFDVTLHEVRYTGSDGVERTIPDRRVVERSDTHAWLGIVSAGYPAFQYAEAFDFMDAVGGHYVAAGALRGGRQGFMVVRPPVAGLDPLGGDPHDLYVVLRTSHDCTRAVEVSAMPLRGRCTNQLTLRGFASNAHYRVAVKHSPGMREKLHDAQNVMKNLDAYVAEFGRTATRLAERSVSDETATTVLRRVLRDRPRRDEAIENIVQRWHASPTVGYDGTGWGLVNAVSEYYEWGRAGGTPESRFLAALQGQTHGAVNRTATLLLSRAS